MQAATEETTVFPSPWDKPLPDVQRQERPSSRFTPVIKRIFAINEAAPTPNAVTRFWQVLRNHYHYHPKERVANFVRVQLRAGLGSWRRIPVRPSAPSRMFYTCTTDTPSGRLVVKVPMGNDELICRLIRELRSPATFDCYRRTLTGMATDPWLKDHCVKVMSVAPDGGYTSEFVDGFNLADVRDALLSSGGIPAPLRPKLVDAIGRLVTNLNGYAAEHGRLVGDWFLHNLIFSPGRNAVVNIDAEGFFTWRGDTAPSNLQLTTRVLADLAEVLRLLDSASAHAKRIVATLRILEEVRLSGERYAGHYYIVGYHSLNLAGVDFRGQRNCAERLAPVPFDFTGKVVVDLGCNCGGMLHALCGRIERGYGFDYNPKCINAAASIRELNHESNLEFFNFDFDRDDLSTLRCFLGGVRPDICFLLAVCVWITRRRELIREASRIANTLLFESNGTIAQQQEQLACLRECFADVHLVSGTSSDDFTQDSRRLYLCSGSRVDSPSA